jgi:DeoR/GlpR family transcriptional regulator of sugar metabolism
MSSQTGPTSITNPPRRHSAQQSRQDRIAELVIKEGTVRVEELVDHFGVSAMTIHRDLSDLERRGLLRKTRGQATALPSSLAEASVAYRITRSRESKRALAAAALDYIEPGKAIVLDDSTTLIPLIERLPERTPLTVITPFLTAVNMLTDAPGISLISLGGQYYPWADAFLGGMTIELISQLRADICVMSTSAVVDDVCYHQMHETVMVKKALMSCAKRKILLLDHTKFDQRALHALAPLDAFDLVIVDADTAAEHIDRLRTAGIHLEVAPKVTD